MKYYNECNTIEVKNKEGNTTSNEYDSIGRLTKQIDGRNNEVSSKYDRNNNVVEVNSFKFTTNSRRDWIFV